MRRVTLSTLSVSMSLLAVLVVASQAGAGEVSGTVKKIDAGKSTITITVDGTDKTFPVNKDASLTSVSSTKSKKGKVMEVVESIDNLSGIKPGAKVTLLTETLDEKNVIRAVKVLGGETTEKTKAKKKKDK